MASFRVNYVSNALRMQVLAEIGGSISFDGILSAAIERAKKKSRAKGLSDALYGTWHQHVGSTGHVFDAFREILEDLNITTGHGQPLLEELNKRYGTGASLYHA
jgi:hypothetical protein